MGKKEKLFSDKELRDILEPVAEQIKLDIKMITKSAVADFYADYTPLPQPRGYVRTNSFDNQLADNLYIHCKEKYYPGKSIELTFGFDASEVSVSQGDPNWAFDADFIHGFHGGPHNIGNGVYSWTPVPRMIGGSPWDIISRYIDKKYK